MRIGANQRELRHWHFNDDVQRCGGDDRGPTRADKHIFNGHPVLRGRLFGRNVPFHSAGLGINLNERRGIGAESKNQLTGNRCWLVAIKCRLVHPCLAGLHFHGRWCDQLCFRYFDLLDFSNLCRLCRQYLFFPIHKHQQGQQRDQRDEGGQCDHACGPASNDGRSRMTSGRPVNLWQVRQCLAECLSQSGVSRHHQVDGGTAVHFAEKLLIAGVLRIDILCGRRECQHHGIIGTCFTHRCAETFDRQWSAERCEGIDEFLRRLISARRIPSRHPAQDGVDGVRDIGPQTFRGRCISGTAGHQHLQRVVAGKRHTAGEQPEERAAETVDVAANVDRGRVPALLR